MNNIILASTSIYRKQQLERLHTPFTTAAPDIDEEPLKAQGLDPITLSKQLSLLKARAISAQHPDAIVIGGDQVASFNQGILSKPKTKDKACEQLSALSGNSHQLITSLAIIAKGEEYVHTCIAKMKMRALSPQQISRYIDIDEPLHSCGSYRLEALGISLFENIECEDYTSIIGIPLMWTARKLTDLGIAIP
ncbi:MAG: nucleoside triphosphate pyrophosphatase [Candidatus Pelagadaptatus aseana]|uniref:Maf family protein n=1 Tax=Candidatus Pelagadaptatus aseana TaxID=3120508 RepID=UPI0039B1C858